MPYATPLTEPEITAALESIPDWRREGDWLLRTVECPTFRASKGGTFNRADNRVPVAAPLGG